MLRRRLIGGCPDAAASSSIAAPANGDSANATPAPSAAAAPVLIKTVENYRVELRFVQTTAASSPATDPGAAQEEVTCAKVLCTEISSKKTLGGGGASAAANTNESNTDYLVPSTLDYWKKLYPHLKPQVFNRQILATFDRNFMVSFHEGRSLRRALIEMGMLDCDDFIELGIPIQLLRKTLVLVREAEFTAHLLKIAPVTVAASPKKKAKKVQFVPPIMADGTSFDLEGEPKPPPRPRPGGKARPARPKRTQNAGESTSSLVPFSPDPISVTAGGLRNIINGADLLSANFDPDDDALFDSLVPVHDVEMGSAQKEINEIKEKSRQEKVRRKRRNLNSRKVLSSASPLDFEESRSAERSTEKPKRAKRSPRLTAKQHRQRREAAYENEMIMEKAQEIMAIWKRDRMAFKDDEQRHLDADIEHRREMRKANAEAEAEAIALGILPAEGLKGVEGWNGKGANFNEPEEDEVKLRRGEDVMKELHELHYQLHGRKEPPVEKLPEGLDEKDGYGLGISLTAQSIGKPQNTLESDLVPVQPEKTEDREHDILKKMLNRNWDEICAGGASKPNASKEDEYEAARQIVFFDLKTGSKQSRREKNIIMKRVKAHKIALECARAWRLRYECKNTVEVMHRRIESLQSRVTGQAHESRLGGNPGQNESCLVPADANPPEAPSLLSTSTLGLEPEELKTHYMRKIGVQFGIPGDIFQKGFLRSRLSDIPNLSKHVRLMKHQHVAVSWMAGCYMHGQSVLFCDEMGLGKTLTCLSFLDWLTFSDYMPLPQSGRERRHLVVCPSAVVDSWARELRQMFNYGTEYDPARGEIDRVFFTFVGDSGQRKALKKSMDRSCYKIWITTPEVVYLESSFIRCFNFDVVIVDEAYRLKNSRCRYHRAIRELSYKMSVVIMGTPIHEELGEFWGGIATILFRNNPAFQAMDKNHPLADGDAWINAELQDYLDEIHEAARLKLAVDKLDASVCLTDEEMAELRYKFLELLLKPVFLRRVKKDILLNLPGKKEVTLTVAMNALQLTEIQTIKSAIANMSSTSEYTDLLNSMKRVYQHPVLNWNSDFVERVMTVDDLIRTAPKLEMLDRILPKLIMAKRRVVIFSQQPKILDIIGKYCTAKLIDYCRIDGNMSTEERQRQIEKFVQPRKVEEIDIFTREARIRKEIRRVKEKQETAANLKHLQEHSLFSSSPNDMDSSCFAGFSATPGLGSDAAQASSTAILSAGLTPGLTPICNADTPGDFASFSPLDSNFIDSGLTPACSPPFSPGDTMQSSFGEMSEEHEQERIPNPDTIDVSDLPTDVVVSEIPEWRQRYTNNVFEEYDFYKRVGVDHNTRRDGAPIDGIGEPRAREPFVFMLSTRSGAMGLNLQKANVVIFYDEERDDTLRSQAVDRVHRIGQTEEVLVINLRSTAEEEQKTEKRESKSKVKKNYINEEADFDLNSEAGEKEEEEESTRPSKFEEVNQLISRSEEERAHFDEYDKTILSSRTLVVHDSRKLRKHERITGNGLVKAVGRSADGSLGRWAINVRRNAKAASQLLLDNSFLTEDKVMSTLVICNRQLDKKDAKQLLGKYEESSKQGGTEPEVNKSKKRRGENNDMLLGLDPGEPRMRKQKKLF